MKKVLFIILVGLASCGPQIKENKIVNKVKDEYKPIIIDTATNLEFTFKYIYTSDGIDIFGVTNLPDSTKLGASLYCNGKTCDQNFDIYIIKGHYYGSFTNYDTEDLSKVEIECFNNSSWQTPKIRKQLDFIKTDKWILDTIFDSKEFSYSIDLEQERKKTNEAKVMKMRDQLGVVSEYVPISKIDGSVKDVSYANIKRYSVNLRFSSKVSDEVVENEIRYWIFQIWKNHKDANAIMVACFIGKKHWSFKNGEFAPNGKWEEAKYYLTGSDLKLGFY